MKVNVIVSSTYGSYSIVVVAAIYVPTWIYAIGSHVGEMFALFIN
jgi:uncharacterized membrane protein (DUF2068 family)